MTKRLNETLGAMEYDGLIVANEPVADVVTVQLSAGTGVLKRGTVITGTAGGELATVAAALTTGKAIYVLADDTDVTTKTTATAYRTGHFARNLLVTGAYTLTAADEEIMRAAGILLSDAVEI